MFAYIQGPLAMTMLIRQKKDNIFLSAGFCCQLLDRRRFRYLVLILSQCDLIVLIFQVGSSFYFSEEFFLLYTAEMRAEKTLRQDY